MSDEHIAIYLDGEQCLLDTSRGTFEVNDTDELERLRRWVKSAEQSGVLGTGPAPSAATRACLAEAANLAPLDAPHTPSTWRPAGTKVSEPVVRNLPDVPFATVVRMRKSEREFSPPSIDDVLATLTHSGRVRAAHRLEDGFLWTTRPAPSAGGCHPIELFASVEQSLNLNAGIYWFDPVLCELRQIPGDHSSEVHALARNVAGIISELPPALIILIANLERTAARYRAPTTLVLRDAGALLTTMSLTATALGLSSCIVGTCGGRQINRMLGLAYPKWVEVGALALGRRPTRS